MMSGADAPVSDDLAVFADAEVDSLMVSSLLRFEGALGLEVPAGVAPDLGPRSDCRRATVGFALLAPPTAVFPPMSFFAMAAATTEMMGDPKPLSSGADWGVGCGAVGAVGLGAEVVASALVAALEPLGRVTRTAAFGELFHGRSKRPARTRVASLRMGCRGRG